MEISGLVKAIKLAGGPKALADSLGCTPQVVCNWRRRRRVPTDWCPAIERITTKLGKRVPCTELRPDVFSGRLQP
jgi:DNA-binding transcriptional regulator YdaS (Cro superfamily)